MCRPSDLGVNWMWSVQGKSPLVQVKEPYSDLDMVTILASFHPPTWSVQSTPADNAREGVWPNIEKERKGLHCFPKYPFRGFQYTKG